MNSRISGTATALLCLAVLTAARALPARGQTYYARGTFYAGEGEPWSCDAGNQLYDDGLHEDGAPGDGVYGAVIVSDQQPGFHEWKIATEDWTENYPNHPDHPLANAVLYTLDQGESIRFTLDTNTMDEGWQPATDAVACDHFTLPGTDFELIGSQPELGAWLEGIPVDMDGGPWVASVTIASPGVHEFKFRVVGTWDICNLGPQYDMFIGDNFTFETTEPATKVKFEFNPGDGRGRAVLEGSVPVDVSSWGRVKGLYR